MRTFVYLLSLCTDNAAMIAAVFYRFEDGRIAFGSPLRQAVPEPDEGQDGASAGSGTAVLYL